MHYAPLSRALLTVALLAASSAACSKDPDVAKRNYVQSGDAYVAKEQHQEAIIEYRNALQQDPYFGEARAKLAESYWVLGDRANASAEFVRAAELLPDDVDLQLRAGNVLLVHRQFDDALNRADRALAVNPRDVRALVLRANGLAGLNHLEDALADIDAAIDQDPDNAGSYATLGAVQLIQGDRRNAEAAFTRAVEIDPSSVQAHLALANFYLAVGNRAATEAALKATIALAPTHLVANRALAYLYLGSGQAAEAESYLRTVAEASPDAAGHLSLAEYYASQGRLNDAKQTFERVAEGDDRHAATAKLRLAAIDFTAGNAPGAARRVDTVLAADPANTQAIAAKAELLAASGDLDGALSEARRAVDGNRRSPQAHFVLGTVHLLRKELSDAETAFSDAMQLNTRLVPARVELAKIYLTMGRLPEAEQLIQGALQIAPTAAEARLTRARIALRRGDVARAEPILRTLEREAPQSAAVLTTLGLLELTKRQPARARAALTRALALDGTSLDALRLLTHMDLRERRVDAARERLAAAMHAAPGNTDLVLLASTTAAAIGDFSEAERLAKSALEANANAIDAYAVLGRIYGRTNRLAEATMEYQRLGERQPRSVTTHTIIGVLLQMQGRNDEARTVFERVMQMDDRAAVAANNLAWIYAEQGDKLDAALQLAQTAKGRLPNQPEVSDTLGWVYYKRGLSAMAIGPLQEAVAGNPENATYHYHLGLAHAAAGDANKAREALKRALTLDASFEGAAHARTVLSELAQ